MTGHVVLGGRYENALMRSIAEQKGELGQEGGHEYYDSLYRRTPRSFFERTGTLATIFEGLAVPLVDWSPEVRVEGNVFTAEDFGIKSQYVDKDGRTFHDSMAFAEALLKANAFSLPNLDLLTIAPFEGETSQQKSRRLKHQLFSQSMQLSRILLQINEASESRSPLVIAQDERNLIRELGAFVELNKWPTPFDIPDLSSLSLSDGDHFAGGLLNFSPQDALSLVATRKDAQIQEYARTVRSILSKDSSFDSKRDLVVAMRAALEKSDAAKKVDKVFEMESLIFKPLHYVPGLDSILTVLEDGLDLGRQWIARRSKANTLHLLTPRMQEISLHDYLQRTGNL
jgi:hypothetical protein